MARPPDSILVLRLGGIGEVLAITPALRAIRDAWPRARVTLLAERPACEVAGTLVDEVIVANAPYRANGVASLLRPRFYVESMALLEGLLRRRFDLYLDFHHLFGWRHILKPMMIALLSRAPRRVGFTNGTAGFFLTDPVPDPDDRHMTERSRALLASLGVTLGDTKPILSVAPGDRAWMDSSGLTPPLIAISPGSSRPVTRWGVERFAEVARRLASRGTIVLIGTRDERALCEAIPGVNLAGKTTVGRVAALLERCSLLVTNDSGPLHIAYALGTPVVGIFRPVEYRRWGAYSDTRRFRAFYREGPGAQEGATLPLITVDEVVAAGLELLV